MTRNRKTTRKLRDQVVSTFENGFGDESPTAKLIGRIVLGGLILLSTGFAIILAPAYLAKRASRMIITNKKPPQSPTNTPAS